MAIVNDKGMNKSTLIDILRYLEDEDEVGILADGHIRSIEALVVERIDRGADQVERKNYLTLKPFLPSMYKIERDY